jgi:hypothetical protein
MYWSPMHEGWTLSKNGRQRFRKACTAWSTMYAWRWIPIYIFTSIIIHMIRHDWHKFMYNHMHWAS